MRLGLGTAQFGLDYGISNTRGKIPRQEAAKILDFARQVGIGLLDTAPAYGESECLLGQLLGQNHAFDIVTKTVPLKHCTKITPVECSEMAEGLSRSLERLGQTHVYGLLLHSPELLSLPGIERFLDSMRELAQQGVVSRIGISVYTGAQIDRALELFEPDIIQLPINLFDQRLLQSGHLRQLKSRGIEVHARSVFLQGLLFMDPEQLGGSFSPARPHFEHYRTFLRQHRLTPLQAALQFVSQLSELDAILVGVTALSDLREVVEVHRTLSARPALDMSCLAFQDERILNPAFWSTVS